jgi:hypothetical protein
MIPSTPANFDEFSGGQGRKFFPGRCLITQVAPEQAVVRLTDFDKQLSRLVMRHTRDVEALVGFTVTKNGNVKHKKISDFEFRIADFVQRTVLAAD